MVNLETSVFNHHIMKIVIIGGTGHTGSYLVPMLVTAGHEVTVVTRQERKPYMDHTAWKTVKYLAIDRQEADRKKTFGKQIRKLSPDIVIDMICFTPESAKLLVESLAGEIQHFLHCGTIWVHGYSEQVPTTEMQARKPFGDYGIKKAAIEEWLLAYSRKTGFPATILHPGHIVGPGWIPLNPAGHFNPQVYKDISIGRELVLPNLGMETVHHVHAGDLAQAFFRAIYSHSTATGESFHVVSPGALTLRGYAEAMYAWAGKEPKLKFLPWEKWKKNVSEKDAAATWDHIAHSPNCSIEKARKLLGYEPRYTSLQAVQESVKYLFDNKLI